MQTELNFTVEIIPEPEWDKVIEKIFSAKKTLLIGQVDCGKSTFAKYVIKQFLKNGSELVFLDSDIGQSSIALPGTIGVKKYSGEDLNTFADRIFFTGFTTPSVSIERFLQVFSEALKFAESYNLPILVDTTGFVTGAGKSLKLRKIEILKPDLIIAFQKEQEIKDILDELKTPFYLLKPSQNVLARDQQKRALYRKSRFQKYFQNSCSYLFSTKLLREETKSFVYNPQSYIGRIVGLFSDIGCIAVGIIEEIDEETTVVKTPLKEIKKVRKIIPGEISLAEIFGV